MMALGPPKEKNNRFTNTHLLLPFLKVEKHEFVVRKSTLSERQADSVRVSGPTSPVQSECWHF